MKIDKAKFCKQLITVVLIGKLYLILRYLLITLFAIKEPPVKYACLVFNDLEFLNIYYPNIFNGYGISRTMFGSVCYALHKVLAITPLHSALLTHCLIAGLLTLIMYYAVRLQMLKHKNYQYLLTFLFYMYCSIVPTNASLTPAVYALLMVLLYVAKPTYKLCRIFLLMCFIIIEPFMALISTLLLCIAVYVRDHKSSFSNYRNSMVQYSICLSLIALTIGIQLSTVKTAESELINASQSYVNDFNLSNVSAEAMVENNTVLHTYFYNDYLNIAEPNYLPVFSRCGNIVLFGLFIIILTAFYLYILRHCRLTDSVKSYLAIGYLTPFIFTVPYMYSYNSAYIFIMFLLVCLFMYVTTCMSKHTTRILTYLNIIAKNPVFIVIYILVAPMYTSDYSYNYVSWYVLEIIKEKLGMI